MFSKMRHLYNSQRDLSFGVTDLMYVGEYDTVSQTGWLKYIRNIFFTILEAGKF